MNITPLKIFSWW